MNDVPPVPLAHEPPIFLAGGDMGRRLRAHPWTDSSLGPPQRWPQPLRTLVDLMLSAVQPMFIVWGPQRTLLYNDAYAEVLATKHPSALGLDFLEVWHEIRADLEPLVSQAYAGVPVHMDDIELIMQRKGFVEETHFSFSYTPVRDESGLTAGFFCPCNDITGQVLAERGRRESEARARGVLDGMAESFALLGPDFTILDANAEALRLDTRPREQLIGLTHWEAYPGSENSEIGRLYQHAMTERVPVSLQHSHEWEDGRQTWLDMRAFPTADGLAVFFSDVTERKKADAALQLAAERSMRDAAERDALLGQLGEGVIVTDAEGRITFVNEAAERLHGVKLLGVAPEAYSHTYRLLTEAGEPHPARELPLARAVLDREVVVDARWRIRRPDGTEVLAIGNARPVLGPGGALIGGVLTVRDDTQRSRVEAALRETEERYRLAARATDDAIWDWHFATNHVLWTETLERAYGHKLAEVAPAADWWVERIHPQDRARIDAGIRRAIDGTADTWTDEYRFLRADGTYADVLDRGHLIRDETGNAVRMIGAMLDLTERRRAEAARADNEERLRLATEAAEVGFWDVDVTRDVLVWPPRVKAMFGISEDVAVTMRDYYDGLHPDDRDAAVEAYAAAADSTRRALYDVEYRTIGKEDGVVRWVAAKGRGVFDTAGHCIRVIGTAIDITERKRIEARRLLLAQLSDRIRELEDPSELSYAAAELLGNALNVSRVGYGTLDQDAETLFVERNWLAPGVVSLTGRLRLRDFGSLEKLKRGEPTVICDVRQDTATMVAPSEPLEATSRRAIVNVPVMERGRVVALLFANDSRPRDWQPEDVEMIRDFAGRIRTAVERSRNEVALRQLASTLEQQVEERTAERDRMWETSPDLMVVVDFKGVLRRVNPAWGTLLGYNASDLVGHHVNDFVISDDHLKTVDAYETAAIGGRPVIENRYRHKSGALRWISWVAAPAGDVTYAVGRDVTAEKEQRAELEAAQERLRQAQKMEAVGQLTGGIAHDFNNMLAVVLGSLDLIKRRMGAEDARIKRYLDAATDGARRAALLTQRLLAFSRQQPLKPEPTDVNKLVIGMSELIRGSIGSDIRFETVLAAGGWRTHADPNQLENVLLNLAVNGRDAMPEGGRLTIETQNTHIDARYAAANVGVPAGQYVLIAVTDTGHGMPAEVIAKAFDPFFTTKEVGKGTGLGLSQVYGFVRQSGGNVKIYSEPGQGTTVKVYLPRLTGGEQDGGEVDPSAEMPLGDLKEVVLVVEDEPSVRQFSVDALSELGYRVLEADGAPAALRLLDAHPDIKLLFTDVVMPETNGRKLADEATRRRPDLKVLFTTGYTRNAIVHNGMLDPGVELIGKPFTIEELALKVRDVLDALTPGTQ